MGVLAMKAISPVIATVIIVAVAIALAIAVALWITGVIGGVSRFERLDITATYWSETKNFSGTDYYVITIEISNKGSVAATIDKIFVNNKPITTTGTPTGSEEATWTVGQATLNPGDSTTITLYLSTNAYKSGQVIQIIVHTSTGGQYPTQVTLP